MASRYKQCRRVAVEDTGFSLLTLLVHWYSTNIGTFCGFEFYIIQEMRCTVCDVRACVCVSETLL